MNRIELRDALTQHFNLEEIRLLCFALDIHYDELRGDTLSAKSIALVEWFEKRETVAQLAEQIYQARPQLRPPTPTTPINTRLTTNPFGDKGKVTEAQRYLVRQPMTRMVFDELSKHNSVSLVGDSQTGKSSLLWYVAQQAKSTLGPDHEAVYLDMQLLADDNDFYDELCYLLQVQPVCRGLQLMRKLRGRKVVLCLDEMEKMTWRGFSHDLRSELRGMADGPLTPLRLLIASRNPLDQLFPDSAEHTSPLGGLCHPFRLPHFSLAEAEALVMQRLGALSSPFHAEAVRQAWQRSAGHPARLQAELWQLMQ